MSMVMITYANLLSIKGVQGNRILYANVLPGEAFRVCASIPDCPIPFCYENAAGKPATFDADFPGKILCERVTF